MKKTLYKVSDNVIILKLILRQGTSSLNKKYRDKMSVRGIHGTTFHVTLGIKSIL